MSEKWKSLDLGCGQGRDVISLARLGFTVTGIDMSQVGIEQMNHIAMTENLQLNGIVGDIYNFDKIEGYDYILLDSIFHFTKKELKKETDLIKNLMINKNKGCMIVCCIQDSGEKIKILKETINAEKKAVIIEEKKFKYTFENNGHQSESNYRMIVFKR